MKPLEKKKKELASKMVRHEKSGNAYVSHLTGKEEKQKGKESLNIPKGEKNEGNKMEEGKNENNRA